jgi:hypothetical protein
MAAHPRSSGGRRCIVRARSSKSLKILIATLSPAVAYSLRPGFPVFKEDDVMAEKTCAACDCELDANPIKVTVGGKTVEVCCDDCAQRLKDAQASASAPRKA